MVRTFAVVLERDDGWWVAHVPALHATAQGRSRCTALRRARALIDFAVEDMRAASRR
jgi:predicted RNase H-like HicB family nuclease